MRRGAVLSFPYTRGLRDAERDCLRRFVAAVPGAQADILAGRNRQEIAILTLAERHVWIIRTATGFGARDASSGQLIAESPCICVLLATVEAALLAGRPACSGMPKLSYSVSCRPAQPPRPQTAPSQDDRP